MLFLLQVGEIASRYQLHTSLPNRSELHIRQKFQWTSEQLKSAYLDLQYFHRRSSKFPSEHLSLLLEWFTPFFIAITLPVQYFGSAAFILSVNIVVLYQFTVPGRVYRKPLDDGRLNRINLNSYPWRLAVESRKYRPRRSTARFRHGLDFWMGHGSGHE